MFAEVETYQEDELLLLRGDRAKENKGRVDMQIRLSSLIAHFLLFLGSFYHPHLNSIWESHRIILLDAFIFILCMRVFYLNECLPCVCSTF